MNSPNAWRDALGQFVSEIRALYGERLHSVILYGSRARGDAQEDSDIDTLVILEPLGDFWAELSHIGEVANRVSLACDVVLSAIPVDVSELRNPTTPLTMISRQEGVPVQ